MNLNITGIINDREARVTWAPGEGLRGDPEVLTRAAAIVDAGLLVEDVAVHLYERASLSSAADPALIVATIKAAFDDITDVVGYEPDELPEDAIS